MATPADGAEPSKAPVDVTPPRHGGRTFMAVLINTALANVTTNYLWWALTFWIYLETRSVLATGIIGGAYTLLMAVFSMLFGTLVDRHRKYRIMLVSSVVTLVTFAAAGVLFFARPESDFSDLGGVWFWLLALIILVGSVVEQLRNIALSTTVTLLVPEPRRANANGLVGTVQGLVFVVTSVFSGLSVGLLGMGGTMIIAIALTGVSMLHLLTVRIPEPEPVADENRTGWVDLRGAIGAVLAIPGLAAMILFTTFNNLIGGVYMALMDPYGLELFPVEVWGFVLGISSVGFIVGGLFVARFGLGRNPLRTMLILVCVMGAIGSLLTIREWAWLYVAGIFLYMLLIPAVEGAEQTVIQKVVPYRTQGRVFGLAATAEWSAAPITAFLIAPLAEFLIIPYMRTDSGARTWSWLLGDGDSRGIALIFFFAGLALLAFGLIAMRSRSYRLLSAAFRDTADSAPAPEVIPADAAARSGAVFPEPGAPSHRSGRDE